MDAAITNTKPAHPHGILTATGVVAVEHKPRHIAFFDHVRGAAMFAVFATHALGGAFTFDRLPMRGWHVGLPAGKSFVFLTPFTYGWAALPVFFVISGFCIHLSFVSRPHWKDFWARRFFRIYPPYLAALLLFALFFPLTSLRFQNPHDFIQLGTHLALVHNFGNTTFYGFSPAFWSIAVEAQLYLIYPLLLLLANRFGWKNTMWIVACIELILRVLYAGCLIRGNIGDPFNHKVVTLLLGCPFTYWFSWSVGAYLAEEYMQKRPLPFVNLPVRVLAVAAVASSLFKPLPAFGFLFVALFTAAAFAKLLSREDSKVEPQGAFSKYIAKVGVWSYSIYLLHLPILLWIAHLLREYLPPKLGSGFAAFCVLIGSWLVIVPLAGLWYKVFEVPSNELGRRFVRWLHRPAIPLPV